MCEHNTTVVIYSGKETTVEICEWGCDQILIYKIMPDGTNQLVREVEHPNTYWINDAVSWMVAAKKSHPTLLLPAGAERSQGEHDV